ncbi:hypothetical protein KC660_04595 [Candidatus Dojkabacteria bacterium]|uniref:Uncharacterized protein n=1 Tax=Candidatus Dojkabacteria bacterium TaxID=2099670 RepID=A0A955L441_9BACT|nr:hypothetical protein [Candidatus Dojkabacteria bacterium]
MDGGGDFSKPYTTNNNQVGDNQDPNFTPLNQQTTNYPVNQTANDPFAQPTNQNQFSSNNQQVSDPVSDQSSQSPINQQPSNPINNQPAQNQNFQNPLPQIPPMPTFNPAQNPPVAVDPLLDQFKSNSGAQQGNGFISGGSSATPESSSIAMGGERTPDIPMVEKGPESNIEQQQKIAEVSEKLKNAQTKTQSQDEQTQLDKQNKGKKEPEDDRFTLFGYKIPQKFQNNPSPPKGASSSESSTWLMFLVERIIKMNPKTQ